MRSSATTELLVTELLDELVVLYDIDGVEQVHVFGSWARRHLGEHGLRPRDIDVLVVGDADPWAVAATCIELITIHGAPLDPLVISSDQWAHPGQDQMLEEIVNGPLVAVKPRA